MSVFKEYSTIIGFLLLALIAIILLSPLGVVFSRSVFIDIEPEQVSGNQKYVSTKMDFGDIDHVTAFPTDIGEWQGSDSDMSQAAEVLEADILLVRGYTKPGLYQPIFLLIMQSKSNSTFHKPTICYHSSGYTIGEEAEEEVYVSDVTWAESYQSDAQSARVPVKKLIVFKEADGETWDRRLVLYFYVKENPMHPLSSDTITMIRVSALIPPDGPYDDMLEINKEFIAEIIPYMFEPRPLGEEESGQPTAIRLAQSGIVGYLTIAGLIFVPLAIIVYPRVRRHH